MKKPVNPKLLDLALTIPEIPGLARDVPLGVPRAPIEGANREELAALSKKLRAMADSIDALIEPRAKKVVDEYGEPAFRFEAKVALPENFSITQRLNEYAIANGFNDVQVRALAEDFTAYYRKTGKKWQDWGATWMTWVRNEAKRKQVAPRSRQSSAQMERW